MKTRPVRLLIVLFVIAMAPRVAYLIEAKQNPLFEDLYLDADSYDQWAREIAAGDGMGDRPFHMAPLYPYLLGIHYAFTDHNLLLLRLFQHTIGAVSAVFLFLVARRLFGAPVGVVAYILGLGYGPFLYFEGQVLASFLGVFFGLLSLHLLLRSLERGGTGLLWAGLALGAGSLARPNLLFFMPLVVLWITFQGPRLRRRAALYAAGFLVALVPPLVHNLTVSGEWIPISTHGGISFYLGNNEYTSGTYVPPPQFGGTPEAIDIYDSKRLAEADTGRFMSATEISNYWYGRSFEWMREHPGRVLMLLGRKILLYFNAFEIPLDYNFEFDRSLYRVLRLAPVSFGVLLALGLAGIFRLPSDGRARGWLLVLFVLANAASVIAFFVCARYRQTAVPAVAILAALFVVRLAEDALAGRWRRFAGFAALALLLAVPIHLEVYRGRETSEARSACILGKAYAAAGEPKKAEAAFLHALSVVPGHEETRMNLGSFYYDIGRYREAVEAFRGATENDPEFAGAWNNLGNALREAGERERAIEAIERALRIDPAYAGAWNNLGYTLALAGREDDGERAYERAIGLDPESVHAWANLTDLLIQGGRLDDAVSLVDRGAERNPGSLEFAWKRERTERAAAAYRVAVDAAGRGDRAEAGRNLAEAIRQGGEPVRRWASRDPALAPLRNDGPGGGSGP
ncbi:MAG: tetratricopeptide repeat protein [Candidatus Eisenbacteria bacterium]